MSYILDALRKSEKERRRGTVPDPLTVQDAILHAPKQRSFWPYLIIAVLILNVAVLGLWFGEWHQKKPDRMTAPAGKQQDVKTLETSDEHQKTKGHEGKTAKESEKYQSTPLREKTAADKSAGMQKVLDKADQNPVSKGSRQVYPVAPQETSVVTYSQTKPNPDNDNVAPVPNRIYGLNELPSSIQKNLPDFNISAFIYSDDPGSRMVRINGLAIREGQDLLQG
jgi:general secretion pathway protein B